MFNGQQSTSVLSKVRFAVTLALLASLIPCENAAAQFGFGFNNRTGVVGGVSVDATGAVTSSSRQDRAGQLKMLRESVANAEGELSGATKLRMVSLAGLQAEIKKAIADDVPLTDEVRYLAGLQRIEYLFVYPEEHDIVLAGPAEGWVVREDASVVGETTGRPVLQLEDLLVALRTTQAAQSKPISVSIEPTAEGQRNLDQLLSRVRTGPGFNAAALEAQMKQAFGPQQVKLTTVDTQTRMAQTLVAADYQMKRLAMNLERSPVAGLPSYMNMVGSGGAPRGKQPRFWMACDYDAIQHSEDRLAWKLEGLGIKAMTEDQFVSTAGVRTGTGQANKMAQRWADKFTEKYSELSQHNAAFGDLRNVMDMNIIATVMAAHELEHVAGCDFGLLRGTDGALATPTYAAPRTISPECSFIKGSQGLIVSASGGVEINPWRVVSQSAQVAPQLSAVHAKAEPAAASHWWWN